MENPIIVRTHKASSSKILEDGTKKIYPTTRTYVLKRKQFSDNDVQLIKNRIANGEKKTNIAKELHIGLARLDRLLA